MQKLVADIATEMSLSMAQQGSEVAPVMFYKPITEALQQAEQVLHPLAVQSISAREWAVMITHAKRNNVPIRDALMHILLDGMSRSALITAQLRPSKPPVTKGARRGNLRLIK